MTNPMKECSLDFRILLRNYLTDPATRGLGTTDSWVASNDTELAFNYGTVNSVSAVTVGGVAQTYRTNYYVDYDNGNLMFYDATSGTVNATVKYGSGWIFAGWPRLSDVTFPRISIVTLGPTQIDRTVGKSRVEYTFRFQTDVWMDRKDSYTYDGSLMTGSKLRDRITSDLYDVIRDNHDWIPNLLNIRVLNTIPTLEEVTKKNQAVRQIWRNMVDIEAIYWWCKE